MTIQWSKGPFTATATVNYVGRFNVTDPSEGDVTCRTVLNVDQRTLGYRRDVAPNYCNVASFTYTNLNFQYAFNKQWTLLGSIQNAFNAKAPVDFETYGACSGQRRKRSTTAFRITLACIRSARSGRSGALGLSTSSTRLQRR